MGTSYNTVVVEYEDGEIEEVDANELAEKIGVRMLNEDGTPGELKWKPAFIDGKWCVTYAGKPHKSYLRCRDEEIAKLMASIWNIQEAKKKGLHSLDLEIADIIIDDEDKYNLLRYGFRENKYKRDEEAEEIWNDIYPPEDPEFEIDDVEKYIHQDDVDRRWTMYLPWSVVRNILGHPHGEYDDDDDVLVEALIKAGAPEWVRDCEGWVDECGWGLYGPRIPEPENDLDSENDENEKSEEHEEDNEVACDAMYKTKP